MVITKKPKWEIRLEKKVEKLRLEVARVTEHIKGNIKKQKIIKEVEKLKESYKENNFRNLLDTLKQKLMAQSNRLRRYRISKDRKQQNIMFTNKPRSFYNNLRTERVEIHDNPPMDEIENYWKSIWSIEKDYNKEASWLEEEIEESTNITRMEEMNITTEDVQNAIKRSHSWKAPGIDKIHNYWSKYITATHTKLAELLNQAIDDPTKIPEFFTQGLTYLKPKTNETNNPTKYRPITCLPTIYKILTKKGGRGVIDIKNLHNKQIENLRTFFSQKAHESPMHHIITLVDRSPLHLKDTDLTPKIETDEEKISRWRNKAVHGVYRKQIDQDNIDPEGTHKWLTTPGIFAETEGFMVGIQDRIIKTRNYSKNVLKQPNITDQCRRCFQYGETIEHITSGCSALANNEYTQRHDNVCKQLHQALMKKYEITSEDQPWYTTQPQPVEENEQAKIYYNRSIITDRIRPHNRPDIVLTIKEKKITYLIDVAIPNTNNLEKKHAEKIEKYIPLAEEIKQMWHQNTVQVIPVIISSTGVIPRKLHESLKMLHMKKNMYIPMQKSVIINTCSIVRRFLNDI
ncbi:hypothetical protein WDU94_013846 [Cyamophila willieti]